ncbi:hypothetical protein, partial [Aphanothece microscopica]|uniref:hypothetical protein n=1 Tax=Aphanothece microscopica TaxID=1049561 RepID=UPI003CE4F761
GRKPRPGRACRSTTGAPSKTARNSTAATGVAPSPSPLKNNLVEKSYIDKVKEIQVKEREVGMKRNAFWLNVMRQFNLDGEPYANVYLRDAFIKDLTPEAVRDAAKKYLTSPNVAKIVLKPEAN